MLRRWVLVLVVGCGGGGRVAVAPIAPPGELAITDVSVVAMSQPGVLAHRTVVVRGGRIAAIGPAAALAVPTGVTAIAREPSGHGACKACPKYQRGSFVIAPINEAHHVGETALIEDER